MTMRRPKQHHRRYRRSLLDTGPAVLALVVVLGCSGPSADDAFCDQVKEVQAAGPLFPARTDGEPVPDPQALEAIVALAEQRPEAIDEELTVLAEAAQLLSEQAEARLGRTTQVEPLEGRWNRSAVEAAQRAVITYAAETCEIDLSRSQG